jgi:hypothetical protein
MLFHRWLLAEIGGLEFESESVEEQGPMRSLTQIAISNQVQELWERHQKKEKQRSKVQGD